MVELCLHSVGVCRRSGTYRRRYMAGLCKHELRGGRRHRCSVLYDEASRMQDFNSSIAVEDTQRGRHKTILWQLGERSDSNNGIYSDAELKRDVVLGTRESDIVHLLNQG